MSDKFDSVVGWRQMAYDLTVELSNRNQQIAALEKTRDRADKNKLRIKELEEQLRDAKSTIDTLSRRLASKRKAAPEPLDIGDTVLFAADPDCEHFIVHASGGGVRCTKCPGWYCL